MKTLTVLFLVLSMMAAILVQHMAKISHTFYQQIVLMNNLHEVRSVLIDMDQAESSQRGYIITGKDYYLQPYYTSVRNFHEDLIDLKESDPADPRLDKIEALSFQKFKELSETIELRRDKGFEAAKLVIDNDLGNELMVEARGLMSDIQDEKKAQTEQLRASSEKYGSESRLILWGSIIASIGSLAWQTVLEYRRRQRLAVR